MNENIMNKFTIYDGEIWKNKFLEIYNKSKYNFSISHSIISWIITNCYKKELIFYSISILNNFYDYENKLILR